MKAKANIFNKIHISLEQEGTIFGDVKPGDCKYYIISRPTASFLIIIKRSKKGRLTIIDRKIGKV